MKLTIDIPDGEVLKVIKFLRKEFKDSRIDMDEIKSLRLPKHYHEYKKPCGECGALFRFKHNNALFCDKCKAKRIKESNERSVKRREKQITKKKKLHKFNPTCKRCGKQFGSNAPNLQYCNTCKAYRKRVKKQKKQVESVKDDCKLIMNENGVVIDVVSRKKYEADQRRAELVHKIKGRITSNGNPYEKIRSSTQKAETSSN